MNESSWIFSSLLFSLIILIFMLASVTKLSNFKSKLMFLKKKFFL